MIKFLMLFVALTSCATHGGLVQGVGPLEVCIDGHTYYKFTERHFEETGYGFMAGKLDDDGKPIKCEMLEVEESWWEKQKFTPAD